MADEFGHGPCDGCHGAELANPAIGVRVQPTAAAAARQADWTQIRADVDNSTWDGPAAMAKCKSSDSPASCFNAICAGKRDGDPNDEDSHALPHHKAPGSPPNHNGVANALARLDETQGLTNKDAARKHLEAHMSAISGSGAKMHGQPAELREQAYQGMRRCQPTARSRMSPARAWFERRDVLVDDKQMVQLDGYASVVGIEYDMWDMFGPYWEQIHPNAFDGTLSRNPDVAFLVNHKGVSMARTNPLNPGNASLFLDVDPRGLHSRAYVNPRRHDVHDLLLAMDDKNVTEMSFAFMIDDGEWDEDFMHFTILSVDIDRGDVSAVNYGANPYTSIEARQRELLADLVHLPRGAQEAAYQRLAVTLGHSEPTVIDLGAGHAAARAALLDNEGALPGPVITLPDDGPKGRSVAMIEALLEI